MTDKLNASEYMYECLYKAKDELIKKTFEYGSNEVRINFSLNLEEVIFLLNAVEEQTNEQKN